MAGEKQEPAPAPPKISAIVVSHNRVALLRRAVQALEASESRELLQIVIVDSGSTDGSAELETDFPNTRFIRVPRNFGLTKAWNLGIRASEGECLFLLHDDTEVAPDTVRVLSAVLDQRQDAAAVCPLVVDEDGNPAPQLGHFPPDDQWSPAEAAAEPYEVEYPRGAALMLRAFFLGAMRQIDDRYGQFGGDAEIAWQIRRAGKKILLAPSTRVVHAGGHRDALRQADIAIGRAVFIGKHQGFGAGLAARIGAAFSALGGFRLGEMKYIVNGQKIDGTQR